MSLCVAWSCPLAPSHYPLLSFAHFLQHGASFFFKFTKLLPASAMQSPTMKMWLVNKKSPQGLGLVPMSKEKGKTPTIGKGLKKLSLEADPIPNKTTNLTGCSPKTKRTITGSPKLEGSLQKLIIPSGHQSLDSSLT